MTSARSTGAPADPGGLGATLELVMSACLPARFRTACEELHELSSESIPEFSRLSDKACLTLHTQHRREATFGRLRPVERPRSARTPPPGIRPRTCAGSALGGVVEGDDAAGEVGPADLLPAGRFDDARELALRWPRADRLGEVDVGVGVARGAAGDRGQRAHQVVRVDRAEDLVDRLA